MKRRSVLKNLGLLTGGLMLMPSCSFLEKRTPIALNNLQIKIEEEELMEQLIAVILPEDNLKGGVSLGVQNFVWVMLDDCAEKKKQDTFLNGLRLFNTTVKQSYGDDFEGLSSEEKYTALTNMLNNESLNTDLIAFLHTTKHTAIWGYKNSEYYLSEVMPYNLIPGAFSYKTKTIDPNEKININA
ncbi:gluconate 2-dehydrogenase subunit 3 family protein [Galbibacter mesophilus]|uniref:gluconate 2-dehydrogenase subunit 3 family protein n=1 Tax=Galbibacter mesophilus TaxID=379069 RepID=UPI00191D5AA0|nr:gluconate 2-dehydrogenase subunit 3 family protein [Galbibacter mesophilus]MCM5662096.1 gluconate 2-dehydrogenase subunit 3 family protein [Galbibacter mesophilus]